VKRFSALFAELDASRSTRSKLDALTRYFSAAPVRDAAWAVYFLAGGKPRQVVPTGVLAVLAARRAGIEDWLFEACYEAVGDLAETIALVLPPAGHPSDIGLADWIEERLLPLRGAPPEVQAERIAAWWDELDTTGRFLLTKLIGGGFRVGVGKLLVQRALAEHAGIDAKLVAERMMGYTDARTFPDAARYAQLVARDGAGSVEAGQPYPFCLAHPLDAATADLELELGRREEWLVEWKYDGIRAQVVKRAGCVWIWSRGEELVNERFPEVVALAQTLADGTVLDGEILVWKDGAPAAFSLLQQRIGRKTLPRKVLEDAPVGYVAYDLLEEGGVDVRAQPQDERRARLERIVVALPALGEQTAIAEAGDAQGGGLRCMRRIELSPLHRGGDWAALAALRSSARERGAEGLMLKHRHARYGIGRRRQDDIAAGTWWKWKIEPLAVDGVLVYAQAGHGRRASVYTDYTFAVWNRAPRDADEAAAAIEAIAARTSASDDALQLVPFAKAYSGLTDEEFRSVDALIRRTTIEKFGPVRSVRPSLVFELGFEGIHRSTRHKSGLAMRFPRMLRIRRDKPVHEADTLQTLEALLQVRA